MTDIVEIIICDRAPAPPADQTAFHVELVAMINAEAARVAWPGVTLTSYRRDGETHQVTVSAEPGIVPATIETLRIIRKAGRISDAG